MDFGLFFKKNDISYRLMKAREVFLNMLFTSGIVLLVISIVEYFLNGGVIITVLLLGIIVIIALLLGIRGYFSADPYGSSLYLDRIINGRGRFPSLHELLEENKKGWVVDVLQSECKAIVNKTGKVYYPFCRGKGRYFFLPLMGLIVINTLPLAEKEETVIESPLQVQKTYNGLISFKGKGEKEYERGEASKLPPRVLVFDTHKIEDRPLAMSEKELETVRSMLGNEHVKQLIKGLIEGNKNKVQEAGKEIMNNIKQGNMKGLEEFFSIIGELSGAGGKGEGAGDLDSIRDALHENDLERIRAEFALFIEKFQDLNRKKEILLRMKARVEEYEKTSIGRITPTSSENGGEETFMMTPALVIKNIPVSYRETVRNYFELQLTQE